MLSPKLNSPPLWHGAGAVINCSIVPQAQVSANHALLLRRCSEAKRKRRRKIAVPSARVLPAASDALHLGEGAKPLRNSALTAKRQLKIEPIFVLRQSRPQSQQSNGTRRADRPWTERSHAVARSSGFVNGVDHQCATANEPGRSYAALKSVFDQTCSNPTAYPADVGCKLPEQQARHRIGRLTGADGAREHVRNDGGRRETIIANDASGIMHDQDGGEALLLIGERAGLEPMIESWRAAGKLGNVVGCGEKVREPRGPRLSALRCTLVPTGRGSLPTSPSRALAGPDKAAMKSEKPSGPMRMSRFSISTSSAARTAASRTKSVRDRPRRPAARSIIATSASSRVHHVAIDEVRQNLGSLMSTDALEMLAVEMATAQHLSTVLNRKPKSRRRRAPPVE
jgi:hypothetical protein